MTKLSEDNFLLTERILMVLFFNAYLLDIESGLLKVSDIHRKLVQDLVDLYHDNEEEV